MVGRGSSFNLTDEKRVASIQSKDVKRLFWHENGVLILKEYEELQ